MPNRRKRPDPAPVSRRRPKKVTAVVTVTPRPELWELALKLANGDAHRCVVESEQSVLIVNS